MPLSSASSRPPFKTLPPSRQGEREARGLDYCPVHEPAVLEHEHAPLAAEPVEQSLGFRYLPLRRRKDSVDDGDLRGVYSRASDEAEAFPYFGGTAQSIEIVDVRVHALDRVRQRGCTCGAHDARACVEQSGLVAHSEISREVGLAREGLLDPSPVVARHVEIAPNRPLHKMPFSESSSSSCLPMPSSP